MNSNSDLVSILVVAYNAEKFILATVQSCLNQSYRNIELLILDNASNDKTVDLLRNVKDRRLKVFAKDTNLGPYVGLNFLLDQARGKYIAIQDHDDIWFPKKIEKQIGFMKNNKEFSACGTETFYFYEKRKVLLLDKCQGITDFVNHTSLFFPNKGYRYNPDYVLTDEHFEKKILRNDGDLLCIGEPLTIHRIRKDGNNLSHQRFAFTKKNLLDFFEINGFHLKTIIYIASFFLVKYFPERFVWFVIKIAKRKAQKISQNDFLIKYPGIEL